MLSLDAKGVELTGQAAQASALIPVLGTSPLLERVEFASPATRGRDREQFRIRAAWEVGRPEAAAVGAPPSPSPTAARPKRDEEPPALGGAATPTRPTPGTPPRVGPGGRRPSWPTSRGANGRSSRRGRPAPAELGA